MTTDSFMRSPGKAYTTRAQFRARSRGTAQNSTTLRAPFPLRHWPAGCDRRRCCANRGHKICVRCVRAPCYCLLRSSQWCPPPLGPRIARRSTTLREKSTRGHVDRRRHRTDHQRHRQHCGRRGEGRGGEARSGRQGGRADSQARMGARGAGRVRRWPQHERLFRPPFRQIMAVGSGAAVLDCRRGKGASVPDRRGGTHGAHAIDAR